MHGSLDHHGNLKKGWPVQLGGGQHHLTGDRHRKAIERQQERIQAGCPCAATCEIRVLADGLNRGVVVRIKSLTERHRKPTEFSAAAPDRR